MTKRMLVLFTAMALCAGFTVPLAASDKPDAVPDSAGPPAIFFPEKVFAFQPVVEGVKVIHDFVVMNKGASMLAIQNVRTG